jgi:hypothetical protein
VLLRWTPLKRMAEIVFIIYLDVWRYEIREACMNDLQVIQDVHFESFNAGAPEGVVKAGP